MKSAFRRLRAPLAAAASIVVCLAVCACSETARYRVLSTFFDGVPPPPGMPAPEQPRIAIADQGGSLFSESMRRLRAEKPPPPEIPRIVSVHEPVAQRQCGECHDMNAPGSGLRHDATYCDKCHKEQRVREGWDHGPMNLGTCIPCHEPHRSRYEHLLAKAMPALCVDCHDSPELPGQDYHVVENYDGCIACHDPHRMY